MAFLVDSEEEGVDWGFLVGVACDLIAVDSSPASSLFFTRTLCGTEIFILLPLAVDGGGTCPCPVFLLPLSVLLAGVKGTIVTLFFWEMSLMAWSSFFPAKMKSKLAG